MNSQGNIEDSLELMRKLIEYRYQKALHHQLMKAADHSMLGIDVLILIYHFAKVSEGSILEIGSFVGGSTIAAGLGARDSGRRKKIISIELGGRLKDHRLATKGHLQRPQKESGARRFAGRRHLDQWFFFRSGYDQRGQRGDGFGRSWPVYFRCGFQRPTRHRLLWRQIGESVLGGDRRLRQCQRQGWADPRSSGRPGGRGAVGDPGLLRLGYLGRPVARHLSNC